jgi:HTH-type transcriptional regulator/antitoxin HigA
MRLKMIKTEEEYQEALAILDKLMDAVPGSPEEEELDLLAFLIENYEKVQFPISLPDPIEAIRFQMDQQGLTRKDLEKYIGSQSKVSEVLNRKRPLSLTMIRSLHEGLGISTEVLLQKTDNYSGDIEEDSFEEPSSLNVSANENTDFTIQPKENLLPMVNWPRLSETARRLLISRGLSAEVQEVDEQLFAQWIDDHLDQARMSMAQADYQIALQYIRTLRQGLEQLCGQSPLIKTYCQAIVLLEEQIVITLRFYKGIMEQSRMQQRVLAEVRERNQALPNSNASLPNLGKNYLQDEGFLYSTPTFPESFIDED